MRSLNALADPTRQRIVEMLARRPLAAGQIANRFDVSAPAISQHLKVFEAALLEHACGARRLDALEIAMKNHEEEGHK